VLSSGGEVTVCELGGLKSYDMSALINKENERKTYPSALVAPTGPTLPRRVEDNATGLSAAPLVAVGGGA
jgi:hypothetical protein